MKEKLFFDPCNDCEIKEKEICASCEYVSMNKEQRCELATREYFGSDVE